MTGLPLIERFWNKVDKKAPEECWHWLACLNNNGYGVIGGRIKGKRYNIFAHRLSYEISNGKITNGLFVLHKCDNPKCVNPNHLFLGTYKDNARDCSNKKRHNSFRGRGVDAPRAKLSEEQVREILLCPRYRGYQARLAEKFGVHKSSINDIIARRNWKHIEIESPIS